ncbi:hypothetical protein CUN60_08675 [Aquella oligotrophica]|uniref:DUF2157 domain-containing protein n=2 Tax=Aquella oligotrophica TaxID=2067065 RepID=A0A2I7N7B8_9NEIS|nr:hypothetical protein CUN60_08675 [Aquella oligotrophica]
MVLGGSLMSFNLKTIQNILNNAVVSGVLEESQAKKLLELFITDNDSITKFKFTHLLYYLGGLLTISALTIFVGSNWDNMEGVPLLLISLCLFTGSLFLTNLSFHKRQFIPAGIMAAIALVNVPLLVYNLQLLMHLLPQNLSHYKEYHYLVKAAWLPMEFATLIAGAALYYRYQLGFILFPVSITLWYLSMDLFQILSGLTTFDLIARAWFSMLFGGVELIILTYIDYKADEKLAAKLFWLFLFALITFWGGLSAINDSFSIIGHTIYLLINLFLLVMAVILQRRFFAILGAVGVFWFVADLSPNSIWFSIILVATGFFIMLLAYYWSKIESKFVNHYSNLLPERLRPHD